MSRSGAGVNHKSIQIITNSSIYWGSNDCSYREIAKALIAEQGLDVKFDGYTSIDIDAFEDLQLTVVIPDV